MTQTVRIKNKVGEEIDTLLEGREDATTIIIFVHGELINRNEGANLFGKLRETFGEEYKIVSFDYSGFGKSGGNQEDICYSKMAGDLGAVVAWVKDNFEGKIFTIAHSKGSFITSLLSPENISKAVFTGPPSFPASNGIERLKERIVENNGNYDENGLSIYTNKRGHTYKFGPQWWKDLRSFNTSSVINFASKTKLLIIKPMQDNIVGNDGFAEYAQVPATYIKLNGDHHFSKPEDRKALIEKIKEFFNK